MKRYKVFEVIDLLEKDGWYLNRHNSTSHRQFKNPSKKGTVTVNGKRSITLSQMVLNNIWKQAGWR